jgi:CHAT domain/zinc-ribbon domain
MSGMTYLDFDLAIERESQRYTAKVIRSPCGEGESLFDAPLSEVELRDFGNEVVRTRQTVRGLNTANVARIKEYGARLYNSVFSGEVQDCLLASLREVRSRPDTGLRIRLRLNGAPELSHLPWEYLYRSNRNSFLGLGIATPIVRYLDLPDSPRPLKVHSPLRILVMIASPPEYPPLDTEAEWTQLKTAVAELEQRGVVEVHRLHAPTLNELRWQLRADEYHVFHFIGHGGLDVASQQGVLVLEDKEGNPIKASAERLGVVLHEEPTLRLAVLNSCEGGRAGASDIFSGVAQTLIQQDVPAVVAMQFEISDAAAVTFARDFYRALAFGDPVDAAVSQARQAIYAENELEWGTPVLYMRAADGQLFSVDTSERPALKPKAAAPAAERVPAAPPPPADADLLAKARSAAANADWDQALDSLRVVLARDPGNESGLSLLREATSKKQVEAIYQAMSAHFAAGRWSAALNCYGQIRTQAGTYKDADAIYTQTMGALKREIEETEARSGALKIAEVSGQRFCRKCGAPNKNDAQFCTSCAHPLAAGIPADPMPKAKAPDIREGSVGPLGILFFCFPIVGFVMYVIWKDEKPAQAKRALTLALWGIGAWLIIEILG